MHIYEVRPRKDKRGFDLISDALPFGRLWYGEPDAITNAIGYAKFFSRSHGAAGNRYAFRLEKLRVDVLVSGDMSVTETYFSDKLLTASGEPPNDT
jgi:hypothetical protein